MTEKELQRELRELFKKVFETYRVSGRLRKQEQVVVLGVDKLREVRDRLAEISEGFSQFVDQLTGETNIDEVKRTLESTIQGLQEIINQLSDIGNQLG